MRILVVGAGAVGGYFGGRLIDVGANVTFLVRERRARQLAETGLSIRSPNGDLDLTPKLVTAEYLDKTADLVLLSCKAYDLDAAMQSFAPAVGPETVILPLLNGMRHLDILAARFGDASVLGGQCVISSTLDDAGRILHLNASDALTYGERDGSFSPRVEAIQSCFAAARFESRLSPDIRQDMWEKFVFLATLAGITCLMRTTIGDIVAAGAADLAVSLLDECADVAAAQGFPPREDARARALAMLTESGSGITASMLRDIERGGATEGDHILGDLLRRADGRPTPMLRVATAHLAAYEVRRGRVSG
jgi:2-dehydropantoate 2-reductase